MMRLSFSSIMLKEIVSKGYLLSESFIWHPRKGKPIEMENKSMVSRSWSGEEFNSKGAAWRSCSGWGSSLDSNCCCSVVKSCPTLCDPMDYSTPALHCLLEFAQTHVLWVDDALQPSHTLLPPSPGFSLSHHQGLFQWVNSLHQLAKVLEHQHQSFQWLFRVDFL